MDLKDLQLLTKSYQFSSIAHRNQRRKNANDSIPYINHPIEVCNILAKSGITDARILSGGVLHDTIQDTDATPEQLQKEFGIEVKNYVLQCSDDKTLGKVQRKQHQIQHAKHISKGAKYIKIADKISNNLAIINNPPKNWSKERIFGYFIWSQAVYQNIKGDNQVLNSQMQQIFEQGGVYKLNAQQRRKSLEEYYALLRKTMQS